MSTVMIVDDHKVVADGFAHLIEREQTHEVLGIFTDDASFFQALRQGPRPDVVVLDLAMPGMSGAEILKVLRTTYPGVNVLVVSAAARPEVAARCLREGALGFLSKFCTAEMFIEAVGTVGKGGRYVDKSLFDQVISYLANKPLSGSSIDTLSSREYAVMEKLARGMSIKEISVALNLNAKTVTTYRTRLLKKLDLTSNAELTAYCLRHGVIEMEVG